MSDDPIRSAFVNVVSSHSSSRRSEESSTLTDDDLVLRTDSDWEYLKRLLLRRGTVAPHEVPVLDTIWNNARESARAVGGLGMDPDRSDSETHHHDVAAILTFGTFRRRLL